MIRKSTFDVRISKSAQGVTHSLAANFRAEFSASKNFWTSRARSLPWGMQGGGFEVFLTGLILLLRRSFWLFSGEEFPATLSD
jgi:hypothetical protein